jgi:hypothetical protein
MQGGMKQIFIPLCIPESHPYTVTNTRCRIGTVLSPDDGHIIAPKRVQKSNKRIRKIVHQVGSIYKIKRYCSLKLQYRNSDVLKIRES